MSIPPASPELEQRIRSALRERATTYPRAPVPVPLPDAEPWPRRARHRRRLAVLGAAALIVAGLGVTVWVVVARFSAQQATIRSGPSSSQGKLASPVDAGQEIPLETAKTPPGVESSMRGPNPLAPGTRPITLRAGAGPSVTVSTQINTQNGNPTQCLSIQESEAPSWSVHSTCSSGVLQVFHYPNPDSPADASVFYAWPQVPARTAYVTFDSAALRAWQRPIDGTVVFPVPGDPVDATLRAIGSDGQLLGQVPITKSYNGAFYLPGQIGRPQTTSWTEPAGLTLAERCEALPLSALGPGDGPTTPVFDHATGETIMFDKREYCRQTAALSPDPAGDIVAGFYVKNGAVTADYFEAVRTNSNGVEQVTQGAPIPFDEAQQRIAAQHAARRF